MKSIATLSLLLTVFVHAFSQNFLDTTFSDDGKQYVSIGGFTSSADIALQSDGKILVLSYQESNTAGAVLTRLNSDGTIDGDFGEDGTIYMAFEGVYLVSPTNVIVMPDDRIVVGFSGSTENFELYYGVARYLPNGEPDVTLDGTGFVLTGVDIFAFYGGIFGVAVQPDNKIISYGSTSDPFNASIIMFRLSEEGSIDTSFGDGQYEYQQFTNVNDYCTNMKIFDDHIYLIGHAMIPSGGPLDPAYADVAIARLHMDGSPDISFGVDGVYTNNFSDMGDAFEDIVFLEDNSIVAMGYITEEVLTPVDGISDFLVCKLSPEGILDASFGTDGILPLDFDLSHDAGVAIFRDEENRLVLAGRTNPPTDYSNFCAMRIFENGELDPEFGVNGKISVDLFSSLDDMTSAVFTPEGKILASGTCNLNGNVVHGLARICPEEVILPGVNEVSFDKNLLYPNPCQNAIHNTIFHSGTYEITDHIGKHISSGSFEQGVIPVQNLVSGIYILQIQDSKGAHYRSSFEKN